MASARFSRSAVPDAEDVDERSSRVADRLDHFRQIFPAGVLDDDAGLRRDVGLQVGVGPLGIADQDRQIRSLELARERAVFDQKLDLDTGRQDLVEHPDDQLVLANR